MEDLSEVIIGSYRLDDDQCYRIVLAGLRLGYRQIDTARLYKNEEAVQRAIADSKIDRDEIVVTTKILFKDIEERRVRRAFFESLNILKKIDVVLLHGPVNNWEEGWQELVELKKEGFVQRIGVSNFKIDDLERMTVEKPYCNQIELSPFLERKRLVEYCQENRIMITIHTLFGKGEYLHHPKILAISQRTGIKPNHILLVWGLMRGSVIIGTKDLDHLRDDLNPPLIDISLLNIEEEEDRRSFYPRWIEN